VTDIDRSVKFYEKLPGIKEHFRLTGEEGQVWLVYMKVGERQFIELFPGAQGPFERSTNAGFAHICLEVDDIPALYKTLQEEGIKTHRAPEMGLDNAMQVWIDDPDGNPIEFHQFFPDSLQLK